MSRQPVEAFPVGERLQEELEGRGWNQADFAEIIGRPAQFVSEIIAGKKEITRESATQIAAALDTSPEFWLRYQDQYHLWKHAQDADSKKQLADVRLRVQLNNQVPLAILRRRGVITAESTEAQVEQLCDLLEIKELGEQPHFSVAARRSNVDEGLSALQIAWLACVRRSARDVEVDTYAPEKLRELAKQLTRIVKEPQAFAALPSLFAQAGVRLIYVALFPSSKIDGASFVMDGTPVIGLSGRGQRLDKLVFTLLHEIAHILLGHVGDDGVVLDEGNLHDDDQEDQANDLAAEWALPHPLPPIPARISKVWITDIARQQGVHSIVIVGRLQNKRILDWRTVLAKNAPTVTDYLEDWA
jgi:HTH-type transcriptional regulator/antitoxin HigA